MAKTFVFGLALVLGSIVRGKCTEDPYCMKCAEGEKCDICFEAILNGDGQCRHVDKLIPHCFEYKGDPAQPACKECTFGYRLNSKKECVRCKDESCANCESDESVCFACFYGLIAKDGGCSSEKAKIDNCMITIDEKSCYICNKDYSVNIDGFCEKGPENCAVQIDEKNCLICLPGTHIDKDLKCIGTPFPIPDFVSSSKLIYFIIGLALILIIVALAIVWKKSQTNRGPQLEEGMV